MMSSLSAICQMTQKVDVYGEIFSLKSERPSEQIHSNAYNKMDLDITT